MIDNVTSLKTVKSFSDMHKGLLLVQEATESAKATTLARRLNIINNKEKYILTKYKLDILGDVIKSDIRGGSSNMLKNYKELVERGEITVEEMVKIVYDGD